MGMYLPPLPFSFLLSLPPFSLSPLFLAFFYKEQDKSSFHRPQQSLPPLLWQ